MRNLPGKLIILLLALLLVGTPPARSADDSLGKVLEVDGKLAYLHAPAAWKPTAKDAPFYVQDHFKTDAGSQAFIGFARGGTIGISHGTEVEIMGDRQVKDVTDRGVLGNLLLKVGTVWAHVTKQDQTFQVQTDSCTIGIRGTEFVVEQEPGKPSSISLLQGKVDVTGRNGQVVRMQPGHVLQWRRGGRPMLRRYAVATLRRRLEKRHPRLHRFITRHRKFWDHPYYRRRAVARRPGPVVRPARRPLRRAPLRRAPLRPGRRFTPGGNGRTFPRRRRRIP